MARSPFTTEQFDRVQVGMTRDDTLRLLGKPYENPERCVFASVARNAVVRDSLSCNRTVATTQPSKPTEESRMTRVSLLAVAALALAGCAVQQNANSDEPYTEREYRTGSNLAVKRTTHSDVKTMSQEEIDRLGDRGLGNVAPVVAPGTR
jgi:hypothetical protein